MEEPGIEPSLDLVMSWKDQAESAIEEMLPDIIRIHDQGADGSEKDKLIIHALAAYAEAMVRLERYKADHLPPFLGA